MDNRLEWGLILSVMLLSMYAAAFAEPGEKSTQGTAPYGDPVREYYASKQLQQSPPAVYYDSFYIKPIVTVQCDSWIPVYGMIPERGLLIFTVFSGDFIGYSNVSHSEKYYLINYFYLPCEGTDEFGQINVTYIWNDSTDHEISPNTKAKDMSIDRHFLQLSQTFQIK